MAKINANKAFLLFSGYNYRAIIAFCRELTSLNVRFFVIAANKDDLIYSSAYSPMISAVRKSSELLFAEIEDIVNNIRKENEIEKLFIAPTSEYLNHFLINNKEKFENINCFIPLVNKDLYWLITNKQSFSELCAKNGITIPQKYKSNQELLFPCVAKPILNIVANQKTLYPYLMKTKQDFLLFTKNENESDYYFEEFVEGESFYLLMYFSSNGEIVKYSQKNILQQDSGKSIIFAVPSDIHLNQRFEIFEEMLKNLGFYGLIMIEVKLKKNDIIVIEANPRFWGPSQLFVDNSINIFKNFIKDTLEIKNSDLHERVYNSRTKNYFWFNGLVEMVVKQKKIVKLDRSCSWLPFLLVSNLKNDVYFRQDTISIFFKELSGLFKKELIHGKS